MARQVIGDTDNNVRWQALIVIGEFIPYAPEAVWRVVVRYAESPSRDMRMAVTVLLLEHLLEYDFDTFFARVVRRIDSGSKHLAAMLPGCWGLTDDQEKRVKEYLRGRAA